MIGPTAGAVPMASVPSDIAWTEANAPLDSHRPDTCEAVTRACVSAEVPPVPTLRHRLIKRQGPASKAGLCQSGLGIVGRDCLIWRSQLVRGRCLLSDRCVRPLDWLTVDADRAVAGNRHSCAASINGLVGFYWQRRGRGFYSSSTSSVEPRFYCVWLDGFHIRQHAVLSAKVGCQPAPSDRLPSSV